DAAVERARQHVRRGELARALNQVGRATAYVSDHRGADAVLRSISARRRWIKFATTAGIVALVGASGYYGWALLTRPRARPPVAVSKVEAPPPGPAAVVEPPVETPAPPAASAPPAKKPRIKHAALVKHEEPAPAPAPAAAEVAPG